MKRSTVAHIVTMFEWLSPQDVPRLQAWYTEDAFFKDPFHEVTGLPEIKKIYAHMFEALVEPRFYVSKSFEFGDECVLLWEMHYRFRSVLRGPQVIRGSTHLRLAPDGRIAWHRDYWDAAEELYAKLPLLGALMRWLQRRLRAH